jgi:dTDP-L-rhamnose 4-epimerase
VRVLVTGGAGFIGSHLVDRLVADGHEVLVLDSLDPQVHDGVPEYLSPGAELIQADVRDREAVRSCLERVDRLVHFAAAVGVGQSMYEIEHYMSVNAVGAAIVLEEATALRDRLEKVVVASSMSIYGEGLYRCPREGIEVAPSPREEAQLGAGRWEVECPTCGAELDPLPTPENKRLAPTSIYAIGKRDHEEMFLAWSRAYHVPATALRFFNVFGPRQSLSNPYTGVAAIFASRLLNERPPIVFEDGRQSRDFVHVRAWR